MCEAKEPASLTATTINECDWYSASECGDINDNLALSF
jgi:hypothetical protein